MILHVDMDAYYASVEERDQPELKGKPVIVGYAAEGRGVVCAANYVARQFGVHSAQPMVTATRLCPKAVLIRPRIDYYAQISKQIRAIMESYTPIIEPLSLDEAFLDVGGSEKLFGSAEEIGRSLKTRIADELHLVASVGVAPNKFLAKIASDLNKPDGFVVVPSDSVQEFLDPLAVGRIWGVGKTSRQAFERIGVQTIRELRNLSSRYLSERFGKFGTQLWELAHGRDSRHVQPDHQAKSISHETTFATDISDLETLKAWLLEQTEQVGRRLRRHQLYGKTVNLKLRYADFQTITRSQTLPQATNVTREIWQVAVEMLEQRLPHRRQAVRLLGVGVSGLHAHQERQLSLFSEEEQDHEKQSRLDETTDAILDKFGSGAVSRGLNLEKTGGRDQHENARNPHREEL